jgi:murein DD-endopeptidase MepM/ murein hydrolase activator NlpD
MRKPAALKLILVVALAALVACQRRPAPAASPVPSPLAQASPAPVSTATRALTPSPSATPLLPTRTPTSTPTPTNTPTPTPTARPMVALGDPRGARLADPVPAPGARCGVVDVFDFPLDPPDGANARGGGDFGLYRERFNGIHTGEDWGIGGSNFGKPVYAIGHGTVSYAAPLGWGADQGTVVIRHVLADGTVLYSFYGHLDPPSVTLRAGDCVARGDQIGRIGRPRTPPHLHFEIRLHLPTSPGPGYWSVDPTLAGWLPPSQTIWESRLTGAPGVRWARLSAAGLQVLGTLPPETLVGIQDEDLVGVDLRDGSLLWQLPLERRIRAASFDPAAGVVHTVGWLGDVTAWRLENAAAAGPAGASLVQLWETELDTIGTPHLMPLPGGGLVLGVREELYGLSPAGRLLWSRLLGANVAAWTVDGSRLILTTARPAEQVWAVDTSGPQLLADGIGGRPVVAGGDVFLYARAGVYRLDPAAGSEPRLLYPLNTIYALPGDMVALPTGELMVAHADTADSRLIVLRPDGTVRWERSIDDIHDGRPTLLLVAGRPYLLFERDTNYAADIALFAVDLARKELVRIFDGGARNPQPDQTWAQALGPNDLVLNLAGGHVVLLDVTAAEDAIRQLEHAR